MGNCCNGKSIDDNDIEKNQQKNQTNQNKKENSSSSLDNQQHSKINTFNTGIEKIKADSINMLNQQEHPQLFQEKNLYISKKLLKLLIKQSKCLLEGKEYIINSLGLINSNNKNNHQDGIVIFGDINVSNRIYFYKNDIKYRLILELILYFPKKKAILAKIMQK
jgi:hypothetical protein